MFFKKRKREIPTDRYRIIKIGREAVYECLRECIMDKVEPFFEVSDSTTVVEQFDIDWEMGEFIVVARRKYEEEKERLQFDAIDIEVLLKRLKDTTPSLYQEGRYIELTAEEIAAIQNGEETPYTV